jgi:hypothetical protein
MNPRTVFMRYMGWCPGVAAAAKFVPDRDISLKVMAISSTIFLLALIVFVLFAYSTWIPENVEGPIGELPVEWVRYFSKSDYASGECIRVTRDGGYIIVGHDAVRNVKGWVSTSVYLLKTSSNGTLLWDETYGNTGWDEGRSVIEVEDGYIITGRAYEDLLLMKTDSQGGAIWNKTYGKGFGLSLERAIDGGYVVVGTSGDDVLLLRTDEEGEVLWSKTYGGEGKQWGLELQVTREGGYIIGGVTGVAPGGDAKFYVLKTDSRGNVIWSKTIGWSKGDWLYAVLETPEDGVMSIGTGDSARGSSTWAVKLDKNGEILWSKTYPGYHGIDAQRTSDGEYVILSEIHLSEMHDDVLLMKIDGDGNLEWSKAYGETFSIFGSSFQLTEDGGYIVTGYQDFTALDHNVFLIKIPHLEE